MIKIGEQSLQAISKIKGLPANLIPKMLMQKPVPQTSSRMFKKLNRVAKPTCDSRDYSVNYSVLEPNPP
jgi:hypothetical protein